MKNEGVIHRIYLNNWPPSIPKIKSSWLRVTISDISSVIYLFVIGVILGIIILTLEKLFFIVTKKKKT